MKLRGKVWDVYYAISADINHGECFYDEVMLKEFHKNLDDLKVFSQQLYNEYQKECKDEE